MRCLQQHGDCLAHDVAVIQTTIAAMVSAGPMQEAKSTTVSQQRLALLMPRSSAAAAARPRADIIIQVKAANSYKQVRFCWGTTGAHTDHPPHSHSTDIECHTEGFPGGCHSVVAQQLVR
jgi:hypothetical protein